MNRKVRSNYVHLLTHAIVCLWVRSCKAKYRPDSVDPPTSLPCADFHPLARRKKTVVGQQTHRQSRDQHRHGGPTPVHVTAVREEDNDEGVRSALETEGSGSSVTPAGARRTLTGFITSALGSHSSGGTDMRVCGRERGRGREGGGRGGGGKRRLTKGQRPTGKSSSRKRVRLGELVVGDG